jgi:hypothetical protein
MCKRSLPGYPAESVMFVFNRSFLGVCLAIVVAAAPVLIQYL